MEQQASSWEDFDPEKLNKYLAEQFALPGTQARIDQEQASLDEHRDTGMWWAALISLCAEREQLSAGAIAGNNLRVYLESLSPHELSILSAYMFHNTIHMAAKFVHDGDVAATVADIIGRHNMLIFEKFAATGGRSCPQCGSDSGFSQHDCQEMNPDELSQEMNPDE